jgi:DNA-binding transcriptional ArsR family regulator
MRPFKHPAIEAVALEDVMHALSDPFRLEVVRTLAKRGEASCAELGGERPKSSMSHHFRVLREAGLVTTRGEGVTHWNALRREEMDRRFPGLLDAVLNAGASDSRRRKQGVGR